VKRLPPPVLAVLAALAQRALTRGSPPPRVARAAAAGATAAASGALAASAARRFRQEGTTVDPLDPARASVLVTTGANAVSRNPMYVGLAGLLVANAVRRGSGTALLPVAAFGLVIDRLQIPAEERALLARFGADYEAYRAAVPRWLGRRSLAPQP
jgi:protein-S-isoprenylcysteine O-methyltransferase Ste14